MPHHSEPFGEAILQSFESIPVGIVGIDPDQRILICNTALALMFGFTVRESLGHRVHEVLGLEDGMTLPTQAQSICDWRFKEETASKWVRVQLLRSDSDSGFHFYSFRNCETDAWINRPNGMQSSHGLPTCKEEGESFAALEGLAGRFVQWAQRNLNGLAGSVTEDEVNNRSQVGPRAWLGRLSGRGEFFGALKAGFDAFSQKQETPGSLLILDCDRFSLVNETLGQECGDLVLAQLAQRLTRVTPEYTFLAHLGRNAFALLYQQHATFPHLEALAKTLQDACDSPFMVRGREVFITISVGIAWQSNEHETAEALLRDAETALHQAKMSGVGQIRFFQPEMRDRLKETFWLESGLRRALFRSELEVHFQPICGLASGSILGFEALARWQRDQWDWVDPSRFIPIAERTGLIHVLGRWVVEEGCRRVAEWRRINGYENLFVGINVSVSQLLGTDFCQHLLGALNQYRLPTSAVHLELTESEVMAKADESLEVLDRLVSLGFQLYLDDFGTGYSALSRLARLPFTVLKIDRSFIAGTSSKDQKILEAMVALAHNLDKEVVIEGIEEPDQLERVTELGCLMGQGVFLGRPQSGEAVGELMIQRSGRPAAS